MRCTPLPVIRDDPPPEPAGPSAVIGWPGRCARGRRLAGPRRAWRFAFVWLLLLAVPFQGFADAWLRAQGTAHTHAPHAQDWSGGLDGDHDDHDHQDDQDPYPPRLAGGAALAAGTFTAPHPDHVSVEHHHHRADDASVVIAHSDEQQHEDAAAQDAGAASAHLAMAQAPWIVPCAPAGLAPTGRIRLFSSRTPTRLDRPPIIGAG